VSHKEKKEAVSNYVREFTDDELRALISKLAQKWFGISGEEAIRIVASGEWKSRPKFAKWASIDNLAWLLPEGRKDGRSREPATE